MPFLARKSWVFLCKANKRKEQEKKDNKTNKQGLGAMRGGPLGHLT